MVSKSTLAVAIYLISASLSFAQESPKPGPEHEKIKKFEGTWDAVMSMGDQKSKATAVYKTICGGMWVESDFTGDLGGVQFQGHGLDGYDFNAKKYVSVWVDSMSSTPMQFSGNIDPKSKLMVMTGESVGPDGKPQKFKNTTGMKDDDHFTFKMYMVQPDGNEELAFTIDYARRSNGMSGWQSQTDHQRRAGFHSEKPA